MSPHSGRGMGRLRGNKRAGNRGRAERVRVQRLSQTSHSTGGRGRGEGGAGGEGWFQTLTSVIRLSRAGKKIAGSVLVVAEDEKTRRLNKKTCVAHALRLIGCVPWIIPGRRCQLGKHAAAYTQEDSLIKKESSLAYTPFLCLRSVGVRSSPVASTRWCLTKPPSFVLAVITLTAASAPITLPTSAHIWAPVLKHAFTQKAKARIICQAKWQPFCFVHYGHTRCVQQTQK